jgi:hypothetical protein
MVIGNDDRLVATAIMFLAGSIAFQSVDAGSGLVIQLKCAV